MSVYTRCDDSVNEIIETVMQEHHRPLMDAGVTVDSLWAYASVDQNQDPAGPALTLHGYPCAAIVRIINLKDRAKGLADTEVCIDATRWQVTPELSRVALIDHELEHIELVLDKNGLLKRDDLGRPKLRMRKHDHQFGWFDSITRRHGEHALEYQQAQELLERAGQLYFPFMKH